VKDELGAIWKEAGMTYLKVPTISALAWKD